MDDLEPSTSPGLSTEGFVAMTEGPYEGVIVVGAPRSGTTLMRRILDAHPEIACPSETNVFSACARFLQSETIAEGLDVGVLSGLAFAGFDEDAVLAAVRELAFGFHRRYAESQGKPRWASKTAFDIFYLDTIERLCAGHAKFICLQRHGLDVAVSLKDLCEVNGTYLRELHEYIRRYPRPLEAFCHAWVDVNRTMHAFIGRHPDNTMLLKYEDLTADPGEATRRIARFIGVEWHSGWIADSLGEPGLPGLGDWKTYDRKTIDTQGVGRWRKLSKHTIGSLGAICNPMLEASGYDPVPVPPQRTREEARKRHELGLRMRGLRSPGGTQ